MADDIDAFLDGKINRIDIGAAPSVGRGADDIDAFLDGKSAGISLNGGGTQRKQYQAPTVDLTDSPDLYEAPDGNALSMAQTGGLIGKQIVDAITHHLPASVASAVEGTGYMRDNNWTDNAGIATDFQQPGMDMSQEKWSANPVIESLVQRGRDRERAGATTDDANIRTAIPGVSKQDVQSLGPSLGQSAGSMGAALFRGLPALALSTASMQRGTANRFLRDTAEELRADYRKRTGEDMPEELLKSTLSQVESKANESGWWEALPEQAGDVAAAQILKMPFVGWLGKTLGKNIATRVLSKWAGMQIPELATETLTQMGQTNAEVQARRDLGISRPDDKERDWTSAGDWTDSLNEIAAPTMLQTTLFGLGGGAVQNAPRIADALHANVNPQGYAARQLANELENTDIAVDADAIARQALDPNRGRTDIVVPGQREGQRVSDEEFQRNLGEDAPWLAKHPQQDRRTTRQAIDEELPRDSWEQERDADIARQTAQIEEEENRIAAEKNRVSELHDRVVGMTDKQLQGRLRNLKKGTGERAQYEIGLIRDEMAARNEQRRNEERPMQTSENDALNRQLVTREAFGYRPDAEIQAEAIEEPADVQVVREAAPSEAPVLQNRNRSTPQAIQQMSSIAANPDYGRLSVSRDFANGAPVVFGGMPSRAVVGSESYAVDANGRRIPVQYAVVSADTLIPSNRADGTTVQEYAAGVPGQLRAIAGNGRVAGLQEAYRRGTAGNYQSELLSDSMHGISPDRVRGISNPVLVRIMPEGDVTADIGDISNTSGTAALSPLEQAQNDARRIDISAIEFVDGGVSRQNVRHFVASMPVSEQVGLLTPDGQPTRQAHDRMLAAIFQTAYNNPELVGLYSQETDAEARTILAGMAEAAPRMAQLQGTGAFDIRNLVTEAAQAAVNARRRGERLADYGRTVDIERSPDTDFLIDLFAENIRSAQKIGELLSDLADTMARAAQTQDGLFGNMVTREQAIQDFRSRHEQNYEGQAARDIGDTRRAGNAPQRRNQEEADSAGRTGIQETPRSEPAGQGAAEPQVSGALELTQQTPAQLREQEASREAEEKRRRADELAAARREQEEAERRFIESRQEQSAENFQLGQSAEDAISGQDALFSRSPIKSVEANINRGRQSMNRALLEKTSVHRAMHRTGMGWVDFVWGDDQRGIQHVISQRMAKDGMSRNEVIRFLTNDIVDTLAKGEEIRRQEYGGSTRAVIRQGDKEAVLVKNKGSNTWVLTGWQVFKSAQKKNPGATEAANDTSVATHKTADSSDGIAGAGSDSNISQNDENNKQGQGDAAFQRTPQSGEALSARQIKNIAKDLLKGMENAPPVIVVDRISDAIPGAPEDARGAFSGGNVYIASGAAFRTGEEVRETIFHEVIGHYGIRGFFGSQIHPVLRGIHKNNSNIQKAAEQWMRDNADIIPDLKKNGYSDEHIHTLSIEEAMAQLAERGERISGIKRFVLWLQNALRFIGLHRLSNRLEARSDAEALDALRKAELFVKSGSRLEMDSTGTPVFSRAGRARRRQAANTAQATANAAAPVNSAANSFDVSQPGNLDRTIREFQDSDIDLKRITQAINNQVGQIDESADAYEKKSLEISRVEDQEARFTKKHVLPILRNLDKISKEEGLTRDEVFAEASNFLAARHALERNPEIIRRNPGVPIDELTHMQDREARQILARWANNKEMQEIGQQVDRISSATRNLLVSSGLLPKERVKAWGDMFKHYVPFMRKIETAKSGRGGGRLKFKHATGSNIEIENALGAIIQQAHQVIREAERNRSNLGLLQLARENPNSKLWKVNPAPTETRKFDPNTGLVEWVKERTRTDDPNVLTVFENGIAQQIEFSTTNERAIRLAEAVKGLNTQQLHFIVRAFGAGNRFIGQWLTTRNPLFMGRNFQRDIQHALVNIENTPIAGKQGQVLKNLLPAFEGMWQEVRGEKARTKRLQKWVAKAGDVAGETAIEPSKMARYAREFGAAGGKTGFSQIFKNIEERVTDLNKELKKLQQGAISSAPRRVIELIDDYNNIIENSIRLSAYATARENGMSEQKAAMLAKELTVNFNRRGKSTPMLNSFFLFSNAAIQGSARSIATFKDSKRARRVILPAMIAYGFISDMVSRMLFGDDDDGLSIYDQISGFVKDKNFILPAKIGKDGFLKIPIAQGYEQIFGMGRLISELIFSKMNRNPAERIADFIIGMAESWNPAGASGSVLQLLSPTLTDPIAQLSENKTFTGSPVYRETNAYGGYDKPAYQKGFKTTQEHWKLLSEGLNWISGGDHISPGLINIEPEKLRLLLTSYHGWLPIVDNAAGQIERAAAGEKIDPARIPGINIAFGRATDERTKEGIYYREMEKIRQTMGEIKRYMQDGSPRAYSMLDKKFSDLGDGDPDTGIDRYRKLAASEKHMSRLSANISKAENYKFSDNPEKAAQEKELVNEYLDMLKERRKETIQFSIRIINGKEDSARNFK